MIRLDSASAERFAKLALNCINREYPNKIAHVLESDADVLPPRRFTPAFRGCYDWHSAVHAHWTLARLANRFPDGTFVPAARAALESNLTAENLRQEAAYLGAPGRAAFERPYGLAWLLQLAAELRGSISLQPLEELVVGRVQNWLPKLSRPVRSGEHANTAFSLGLMLDYARRCGRHDFEALLDLRVRSLYLRDRGCPLGWEPSGEDFLSPCLAEADVVRRVLPGEEFTSWLDAFLPEISALRPAAVTDPSDGKLAHLAGLNLSRAWMLEAIAAALPGEHPRVVDFREAADEHATEGLRFVYAQHYELAHWLGTFAVYLRCR